MARKKSLAAIKSLVKTPSRGKITLKLPKSKFKKPKIKGFKVPRMRIKV